MKSKEPNITLSMKCNLIQNFYVIGFSLEDFITYKPKNKASFANMFQDLLNFEMTPKIISKFPPESQNFNYITDDIIISHCFPKGLKIIEMKNENNPVLFEFELDNIPANYPEDEKNLYSKIYFNCLEFNESLMQYQNLKKEIIEKTNKLINFEDETKKDDDKKENGEKKENEITDLEKYSIPKVICFASLLPFNKEIGSILQFLYNFYITNIKKEDLANQIPIEKIIEQIVIKTPHPFSSPNEVFLQFKFTNLKLEFEKIITFPVYFIKDPFIKFYRTRCLEELFSYFSVDDILKIFKYILLEIPILFFSADKNDLSLFVDNFLPLLSPFRYVLPNISILPSELYGLINSEPKFVFGINEEYTPTFFDDNNIDLDKSIVIINLNKKKGSKIVEKVKKLEDLEYFIINDESRKKNSSDPNADDEYIMFKGSKYYLLNIELPSDERKYTSSFINSLLTTFRKNPHLPKEKQMSEQTFNIKIQQIFYKFFIHIMIGYTDHLLKSKYFGDTFNNKNCGDNLRFKNFDMDFVKEVFNLDEFLIKNSKDTPFYKAFCSTKLFSNFFRDRIYSNNEISSLTFEQFDQLVFLKKHKDFRKKSDNKGLYENFSKCIIEKDITNEKIEIQISNELHFTNVEASQIMSDKNNKNNDILMKYGQLIQKKSKKAKGSVDLPNIQYLIFPKLLFDDVFFSENFVSLLANHTNIKLPKGNLFDSLKKRTKNQSDSISKLRGYMYYQEILKKLNETNNSHENFEIKYISYIYFTWLILLSCSLWYCDPIERNIRINRIFEILNKLEQIEEQVLYFLYLNLYKFGNKYQFIKMHKMNMKFVGYSNYFFLNLLYNKLKEKDEEAEKENEEEDTINTIKTLNTINISNVPDLNFSRTNTISSEITDYDDENNNEYCLKKRYLIKTNGKNFRKLLLSSSTINTKAARRRSTKDDIKFSNMLTSSNEKEEIVFSTEQFCQKCGDVTNQKPEELIKLKFDSTNEFFKYKCLKCENNVENDIIIKYHVLLTNLQKNEAIVTGEGEFKLITPYKFYENIKNYFLKRKNYDLKIDNILNDKELSIPQIIFYFAILNLNYDFLLPYKDNMDNKIKKDEEIDGEFVPIKINYDNDDIYRRFNELKPQYSVKRRYFRGANALPNFTILGTKKKKK